MPIYEYLCSGCSGTFEELVSTSGSDDVACPNCGELDNTKLPVYQAEEFSGARLHMCDNCQTYVKCIDLTKDGHAVPAVDDLATISLSMWAQGQGYRPIRTNLFGF